MERRSQSNGWETFLEHWGFVLTAVIALLAAQVLMFFMRLTGTPWLWFLAASFVLLLSGSVLIADAKVPSWRTGRFLTVGQQAVPEPLRGSYRWGWRMVLFGILLSLCLLLSRQ